MVPSSVRRKRPSWLRVRYVFLTAVIAIVVAGMVMWLCADSSSSLCKSEAERKNWTQVVKVCSRSYETTGDPRELLWIAKAHANLGRYKYADHLARHLLGGPEWADAHILLSYLAGRYGRHAKARVHGTIALGAHTIARDRPGLAGALYQLSQAALSAGDYRAALAIAEMADVLAQELDDPDLEWTVSLGLADVLRRLGDHRAARTTLGRLVELATHRCRKAWVYLKLALSYMEDDQEGLARQILRKAAEAHQGCGRGDVAISIPIVEAWLLRHSDPITAITLLDELARWSGGERLETALLRAYIAADRGEPAAATDHLDHAARLDPLDADWTWEIECARAELAVLRLGLLGDALAELHYRRAIAMIAKLRSNARMQSAHFVSTHRRPFDGLIALLARHQRWRDVLAVVLDLDASDMLRATADGKAGAGGGGLDADDKDHLALEPRPAVEDVLAAWRSRNLLVVIAPSPPQIGPPHERVYRLWISNGQITGEEVGNASSARKHAIALSADPGDETAARELGRIFQPSQAGAYDVLAVGVLGKAPLAVLRDDDGSLLVRKHPLARVLALVARGAESTGGAPSLVLANPTGGLASASKEGAMVREALGPGIEICGAGMSCAASRSRLWMARDADLLHVAGHVVARGRLRALELSDGLVDPFEITQQRLAPRIAVLAGCGSAAATDEEGWGSVAAALLEAGTAVVIATDRTVDDAASLSLMRRFYAQPDWRTDPAGALARVQVALDAESATSTDHATTPRLWAAFTVLRRPPVVARTTP